MKVCMQLTVRHIKLRFTSQEKEREKCSTQYATLPPPHYPPSTEIGFQGPAHRFPEVAGDWSTVT